MNNPASALLELLSVWGERPSNTTLRDARTAGSANGEVWSTFATGLENLRAIEACLDQMDQDGRKTGHWRRHVASWYEILVAPAISWDDSAGGPTKYLDSTGALGMLEGLESFLDVSPSHFPEQGRTDVIAALAGLEKMLEGHQGLSEELREYLLNLMDEIRAALIENRRYGDVQVGRRINELAGFLVGLSEELKDDDKDFAGGLRVVVSKITTFARHAGTGGLLAIGAAADYTQIAAAITEG